MAVQVKVLRPFYYERTAQSAGAILEVLPQFAAELIFNKKAELYKAPPEAPAEAPPVAPVEAEPLRKSIRGKSHVE